jgi:hypothetical protein
MRYVFVALACALAARPAALPAQVAPEPLKPPAPAVAGAQAYWFEQLRPPQPADAAWTATEKQVMTDAARVAWRFAQRAYQPNTGLITSLIHYRRATLWDIGSGLAMLYCAKELGLLPVAEYDRRIARALRTLRTMPMFDGVAYNKNYAAGSGKMVNRRDELSAKGYGWSATDLGRFLVWLRIIAQNDPQHAQEIQRVVDRLDMTRLVSDGYLRGEDLDRVGNRRTYQEGRIGYEQYAALGFALWGHPAANALALNANTVPVQVFGVPLLSDKRGDDRLTSEPFILIGLELGWSSEIGDLARSVLEAQKQRYERTQVLTMVSEDAIAVAPHYFYYYSVYHNGKPFSLDVQTPGARVNGPRVVSTKATFGWHALLPDDYTWTAVQKIQRAKSSVGWGSGIYERTLRSAGTQNVNTEAVVLESALYVLQGKPLITRGAAQSASN